MTHTKDPVHFDNGKWWFWDETWTDRLGPWDTEKIARGMLDTYIRTELGDQSDRPASAKGNGDKP